MSSRQCSDESWTRAGVCAVALTALASAALCAPVTIAADAGCEVEYDETWRGGGGFGGNVVIHNTGDAIDGWKLEFDLGADARVTQGWPVRSARGAGGSRVTFSSDASWNARIPKGGAFTVGFNATGGEASTAPGGFRLNGSVCAVTSRAGDPRAGRAAGPEAANAPARASARREAGQTIARAAPGARRASVFRVDDSGRIRKNGSVFPVRCGSWFGLEGRHEPSNDPTNPRGAPMELYVGNTFWANGNAGTGRTIEQTLREISAQGINVIRLPIAPQTLDASDPQGTGRVLKNHASVRASTARRALEDFIVLADRSDIDVLLDVHSCSNYVGWRAGRLDARPPYVDADRDDYDFTREDASCAATGNPSSVTKIQAYDRDAWLRDLRELAGLGDALGVDNIIGIDVFNEPWDYTWKEWKALVEAAFAAIDAVNPNTLIFVEGISASAGHQDGSPESVVRVRHGDEATNPNWGENLFPARDDPLDVPRERLVFSPHTYGPSVYVQKMFMDPARPECASLEGDAAGDAGCPVVIDRDVLRAGWDEHFGYLREQGFAVVVGEFGGNLDWPGGPASMRDRRRWRHVEPGVDARWQETFVDYMVERGIEGCYWSINPESGDTGGWYAHAYDPRSNPAGWGEWRDFDPRKTALLKKLWGTD